MGCVDIAGQADVLAVEEGLVLYATDHGRGDANKYYGGNGNYVIVLHSNNTFTYYGHFKDSSLKVKTGNKAERGQVLGTSGKTGSATGNHLHFQARQLNSKGIKLAEAKKPTQRSDGYFFNNLVYSAKESSTYKNACPGPTPVYVFDDWFFDMRSEIKISSKLIKQNQNYAHYTWLKGDVSSSAKVSVITKAAGNITQTNAKLNGSVTKQKGANISSVDIKVGKSASSLKEICRESVPPFSNNAGSGTGFDMYYDLSGECGYTLTPNTTYYYQCFAIYNGKEYSGGVLSFTTRAASCQHSYDNLGVCKKCKSSYPLNITSLNQAMVTVKDDVPAHTAPYGAATVTRRLYTGNELAITGQAVNHFGNLWFRTSGGGWLVSDHLGSRQAGLSVATKIPSAMRRAVTFDAGAAANAKGGGTGFDIWCDMNAEAQMSLSPGATYYYQCFAVYNGQEFRGSVGSFTTKK